MEDVKPSIEETLSSKELEDLIKKHREEIAALEEIQKRRSNSEHHGSQEIDAGKESYAPGETPAYEPNASSEISEPSYNSIDDSHAPNYEPSPSYEPSPEVTGFKREALKLINEIACRDQQRAIKRYGGLKPFGALAGLLRLIRLRDQANKVDEVDNKISNSKIGEFIGRTRSYFDKAGNISQSDDESLSIEDNLELSGNFRKNGLWKKCVKIGAKVIGGAGAAAAMVMTGGLGAATSLVWAGGIKEATDGILQTGEQLNWGRKRIKAELKSHSELNDHIALLKQRVLDEENPVTEEEFQEIVLQIIESERELMETQCDNEIGEKKWQVGRSITSSVVTLGTGLMFGVPVGSINYDHNNTELAQSASKIVKGGGKVLDESHRAFWSLSEGSQFGYNSPEEFKRVDSLVNLINNLSDKSRNIFQVWSKFILNPTSIYGQAGHALAGGLQALEKIKLGAAALYLLAEPFRHIKDKKESTGYSSYDTTANDSFRPSYDAGEHSENASSLNSDSESYSGSDSYTSSHQEEGGASYQNSPDSEPVSATDLVKSEKRAVEKYQERCKPDYLTEIKESCDDVGEMDPECRVSICVPAIYSEHEVIGNYLYSLLDQQNSDGTLLDPKTFEVNILVNGTNDKIKDISKTVEVINDFKKEHPEMRVNIVSKHFKTKKPIGYLRKYITDLALLRSKDRKSVAGPLYLVSHDADVSVPKKDYVAKILSAGDKEPTTQVFAGRYDYSPKDKHDFPVLWASRRLWQYLDMFRTEKRYGQISEKAIGANTIFRAEAYARANGYSASNRVAEDITMVDKIRNAYGREINGKPTVKPFSERVYISVRRDVNSVKEGKPLDKGYDNFQNNDGARMRTLESDEAVANIRPENEREFLEQLEREAEHQINTLFRKIFYSMSDMTPEMIEGRSKYTRGNPELNKIQNSTYDKLANIADERTREIFLKACDYLGIGDIRFMPEMYTDKEDVKYTRYRVKINNWNKLKTSLAEKISS
ncbi:MAG: hypothetical protein M1324_04695 [Patescibacteria group bacterium]|nr:hypothetical protein [Patescibacteria group bacterium]